MEKNSGFDGGSQRCLENELVEGRNLSKKLYSILQNESLSLSSKQAPCLGVAQMIVAKFERSLTLLRYESTTQSQPMTIGATNDSPTTPFDGSPKSPDSNDEFKDPTDYNRDDSRKRKALPRSILKVQGCCKSGLEGPIEDGFNWRKYGQKDTLGAAYPRAYFRCTQRSQGCLATKQVQRSDEDPTYFEVTYRGKHTCYQASSSSSSQQSMLNLAPKLEPTETLPTLSQPPEIFWNFKNDKQDNKPSNATYNHHNTTPHFSFTSMSNRLADIDQETLSNNNNVENNEGKYAGFVPSHMMIESNFGNYNHSSDQQGASSSTVATSSHVPSQDFPLFDQGDYELDQDFVFDNPHHFP